MKKYNQKGFTLLEILIALAITAIIGLATGRVVIQVMAVNAGSITRETAIKQVESAVQIISRDAKQTQVFTVHSSDNINFNLSVGDNLVLTWTAWDNTQTTIKYYIQNGHLTKNLSTSNLTVNGGNPVVTVTQIASNISKASGSWDTTNRVLSFTVASTVPGYKPSTETRTFQIAPSPAQ